MLGICFEIVKGDFYLKIFHFEQTSPTHTFAFTSKSPIARAISLQDSVNSGHVDYSYYYQSETFLQHTNFLLSLSQQKLHNSVRSSVFALLCEITDELDKLAPLHGFLPTLAKSRLYSF